jgi:hypothetical protein
MHTQYIPIASVQQTPPDSPTMSTTRVTVTPDEFSRNLATHTWDLAELEKTPIACLTFPLSVAVSDPRNPDEQDLVTTIFNSQALQYLLNKERWLPPLGPKRKDRPFRIFGDPGLPSKTRRYGKTSTPRQLSTPDTLRGTPTVCLRPSVDEKPRQPILPHGAKGFEHMRHRFDAFGEKTTGDRMERKGRGFKCLVCESRCRSCGHIVFLGEGYSGL